MNKQQENNDYDLLILGGGINGAVLFRIATDSKKEVILLDKNDFSSGTSQSSGMMIWGGLLYLKNFEFGLVRNFCKARDRLIENSKQVFVRRFRFAILKERGRPFFLMRFGLALYRILGSFKRASTKKISTEQLPDQWKASRFKGGLSYEEGFLKKSDAQYTLQWLFRRKKDSKSKAYNYSEVQSIEWHSDSNRFEVCFSDYNKLKHFIRAKKVVNACGAWVDKVNRQFGIKTKAFHHLSKGVYILLENKLLQKDAFVVDTQEDGDTICWVPWGNTIMWGPTETPIESTNEITATNEDVSFLIKKLNDNSSKEITTNDIINVRTGIRSLVKEDDKAVKHSLDLSRKAILESDPSLPWHTIFGGKLSGSLEFVLKVYNDIFGSKPSKIQFESNLKPPVTKEYFDGMELPDVLWSVRHTQVRCLEDYLRRRTNVAQWIPVGGLGFEKEYLADIKKISRLIHSTDIEAENDLKRYINLQIQERKKWKN